MPGWRCCGALTGMTRRCWHPTLHAAISQLGGLLPDQPTCHVDAAHEGTPTGHTLTELGFAAQVARLGIPAPIQATQRWPIERTNPWMNGYGKLRRMTDRNPAIVLSYLPRRRLRRHPPTHPARPHPLPVGYPPHHQTTQVITNSGFPSNRRDFLIADSCSFAELRTPLPVGYVHDHAGDVVMDPMPRSRPPSPTCSPRSRRAGRPTRSSPRSRIGGSRCAPTAAPGRRSCAGASSPAPG
jgi:hypothetical protein